MRVHWSGDNNDADFDILPPSPLPDEAAAAVFEGVDPDNRVASMTL